MIVLKTFALFLLTAIAEIVGCYLPYPLRNFEASLGTVV